MPCSLGMFKDGEEDPEMFLVPFSKLSTGYPMFSIVHPGWLHLYL